MFEALPGERGMTFMSYIIIPVHFPKDPFYAPSLTVRVSSGAPGKGWFASAPSILGNYFLFSKYLHFDTPCFPNLGTAVVALRPFAAALYPSLAGKLKLVDEVSFYLVFLTTLQS